MDFQAGCHQGNTDPYRRIAFTSRRLSISDSDAIDMVLQFERDHGKRGITGAIWLGETRFFHILEGKAREVESTYRRLMMDPRHHAVKVLMDQFDSCPRFVGCGLYVFEGPEEQAISELTGRYVRPTGDLPARSGRTLAGHF